MVMRLMRLRFEDRLRFAEVDVNRREVLDALVIADMIIVIDQGPYLFKIARQVVIVVEQDAVSSASGTSARSFLWSGDDTEPRARAPCFLPSSHSARSSAT